MKLTLTQRIILDAVTYEPRTAQQIADEAGLLRRPAYGHLMALNQKGLVRRSLEDSTWRRV